jgi:Cu/Ag efflux pump CusA
VRRQVATFVSGVVVGSLFEDQKVFDVVVRGVPATQMSVDSVRSLLIDTPDGGRVPLGQLANVAVGPQPADIQHEGVSRYVDVTLPVTGRRVGAVQGDVARHIRDVAFPLEYNAAVIRDDHASGISHGLFVIYVLAAALGALLLMQAAFNSWRLAAVFFASVPVGLLGGIIVAYATGWQNSIGAQVGLAALLAFAARQVIVTVRHLQRVERAHAVITDNGAALRQTLVLGGAEERLAPALLAAVAAAAVLLPFLLLGEVAGNELTLPLAGVMLGGLVSTTLLTVLLVPSAYLHVSRQAPPKPKPDTHEPLIVTARGSARGRQREVH